MIDGVNAGDGYDEVRLEERRHVIRRINPHFIFNTLAAIRIETKNNSDIAYDLIYDFSKYLRAVLQSLTHMEIISLWEEISNTTSYINLVRMRFGNNITIHMDLEETDFMLPPLSVQSLVENAVVHGLKKGKKKGNIQIKSYQTSAEYIVQVEDDGIGFDMEKEIAAPCENHLEKSGLQRVRYEVETMTGGNMEIQSIVGNGTVVTLHIPKNLGKE